MWLAKVKPLYFANYVLLPAYAKGPSRKLNQDVLTPAIEVFQDVPGILTEKGAKPSIRFSARPRNTGIQSRLSVLTPFYRSLIM